MTDNPSLPAPLADKAVLITGGARRLGATLARAFHGQGANLVLHYRRSDAEARALAAALQDQRPGSVRLVRADLTDARERQLLAEQAVEAFGRLDVLINNASSFYPTPLGQITDAHWDDLVGSNLKAPLFLSQALAPALARTSGLILNMVDIHARRPLREHTVYCTAKAGLAMLTLSLAKELGPAVRVNGIAPGAVLWPESGLSDQARQQILDETPLGCSGSPGDIASAALYFASAAGFVTGQILAVDGGRSLGW